VKQAEISTKEKAISCARWALEKKAYETTILHMGPLTTIAEYFVICSGRSIRQTRAIANHVRSKFKETRQIPLGMEGEGEGSWILLDYDDVVVHVFHEPIRALYALDKLWSDASALVHPEIEKAEKEARDELSEEDEDWEE